MTDVREVAETAQAVKKRLLKMHQQVLAGEMGTVILDVMAFDTLALLQAAQAIDRLNHALSTARSSGFAEGREMAAKETFDRAAISEKAATDWDLKPRRDERDDDDYGQYAMHCRLEAEMLRRLAERIRSLPAPEAPAQGEG